MKQHIGIQNKGLHLSRFRIRQTSIAPGFASFPGALLGTPGFIHLLGCRVFRTGQGSGGGENGFREHGLGLGCLIIALQKATPPAEQSSDGGAEADEMGIRKLIKVNEVFLVSPAMSKRKIFFGSDLF